MRPSPLNIPPQHSRQMFTLLASECGHSYIAAEFATLDDAEFALDQMYNALEDAPSFYLECAIADLEDQISEHKLNLIADIVCP